MLLSLICDTQFFQYYLSLFGKHKISRAIFTREGFDYFGKTTRQSRTEISEMYEWQITILGAASKNNAESWGN